MILARHASSLMWAGRYLERAETTARSLETELAVAIHLVPGAQVMEWRQVLAALGAIDVFDADGHVATQAGVVRFLLGNHDNPGSVVSSVRAVRENLRVARDRVPVELWEEANRLHLQLQELSRSGERLSDVLMTVRRGCQAIGGVLGDTMLRDEGQAFIVLGRLTERITFTVDLLRIASAASDNPPDPAWVLRLTNSLQAFRRRHGHNTDLSVVTQFVLAAPDVPRTVLACLSRAEERLVELAQTAPVMAEARRRAGKMRSEVEFGYIGGNLASSAPEILDHLSVEARQLAHDLEAHTLTPVVAPTLHVQYIRPGP